MFDNVDLRASFEKSYSLDGTVWIKAYSAAGGVINTPYAIQFDEYGPFQEALADNVETYFVGVPAVTIVSATAGWFQIGGRITAMIVPTLSVSVGHALYIAGGAVADAGSDYSGLAGQFAVCRTASTSATTVDCILIPERILATT
jgi:hypothetical protein